MINILKEIENDKILNLINNGEWLSLNIDYHPPFVERVYIQLDKYRLSLHVIHPCEEGKALMHPHPWQSAFHVLPIGKAIYSQLIASGVHEQWIGKHVYNKYMNIEVQGEMYYSMINKKVCHSVRPINEPVYTVMLNGPIVWKDNIYKSTKKLEPLSKTRKEEILNIFKEYYER